MKFYCVLFDSMPFSEELLTVCEEKNLSFHHQVSNSFTFTSIFSLLTGYLPSQIFETGFGYNSEDRVLSKSDIQLFDKLNKDKWEIYLHNSVWIENVIFNKFKMPRTSTITTDGSGEYSGAWLEPRTQNLLCNFSAESVDMINREIEHIKKIQGNKSEMNEFHFIIYHHHHEAVNTDLHDFSHLNDSIFRIINSWDFEEENSIFWFFSDHGNFKKIDEFNSPPHAWTTWVLSRDNIKGRKSDHGIISILDFMPSFYEELGIEKQPNWLGQSIYGDFNKKRIFYLEDSRARYDLYNSTTACAISCKKWKNNTPLEIEQTSYFLNSNKFQSFNFDYTTRQIFNGNIDYFDTHINEMKKIFKWI